MADKVAGYGRVSTLGQVRWYKSRGAKKDYYRGMLKKRMGTGTFLQR